MDSVHLGEFCEPGAELRIFQQSVFILSLNPGDLPNKNIYMQKKIVFFIMKLQVYDYASDFFISHFLFRGRGGSRRGSLGGGGHTHW